MDDDIDDQEKEKKEPEPDMAQAEQILFYQDVPVSGPAYLQEAAQSKANFAQLLPGTSEWTIGNGVGSLDQLTPLEREERERQEAADWLDNMMDVVEHQQKKLEREREEWSQSQHSYAGIEMTGEEWGEFADKLKGDTPLRKWLLEKLKKDGKTDAKATEMADQIATLAKMQSLPPNHWTPEMTALDEKLKADPTLKRELDTRLSEAKKAESGLETSPANTTQTVAIEKTGTEISSVGRADALAQSSGAFVTAPVQKPVSYSSSIDDPAIKSPLKLTEEHHAAVAAKEPLDAPKLVAVLPPSPTPAPTSPGGGFDA